MVCPRCGSTVPEGARFCELDGTPLDGSVTPAVAVATASCRCGAGAEKIDEQGFCTECGRKVRRQQRDHKELALSSTFGGVSDRGKRHSQNEDDFSMALEIIAEKPTYLMVVCDGVSSSENAQDASEVACTVALDVLSKAVREGKPEPKETMREAIRAANRAVCELSYTPDGKKDPPETTFVAALVQEGIATLGWVGDSRAYWIGAGGSGLLTQDHSWINEAVAAGQMTEAEAAQDSRAHAITRSLGLWEGAVSEEASEPSLTTFALPLPCSILLCSDGLWNYAPQAEQIAALIRQAPEDADAQTLARRLVEYANAQGGRDNITVAIASFSKETPSERVSHLSERSKIV